MGPEKQWCGVKKCGAQSGFLAAAAAAGKMINIGKQATAIRARARFCCSLEVLIYFWILLILIGQLEFRLVNKKKISQPVLYSAWTFTASHCGAW